MTPNFLGLADMTWTFALSTSIKFCQPVISVPVHMFIPADLQAVIEGYLRPMLADNWDRGSLYSYRAFSFPGDMPYEEIRQPVMFITGEKDGALTRGARKVRAPCFAC